MEMTRRQKITIGVGTVAGVALLGGAAWAVTGGDDTVEVVTIRSETPETTEVVEEAEPVETTTTIEVTTTVAPEPAPTTAPPTTAPPAPQPTSPPPTAPPPPTPERSVEDRLDEHEERIGELEQPPPPPTTTTTTTTVAECNPPQCVPKD